MNPEKLMTVKNLMEFLQISSGQAYAMMHRGLPYVTIGQHRRFIKEEVVGWLKTQNGKGENNNAQV